MDKYLSKLLPDIKMLPVPILIEIPSKKMRILFNLEPIHTINDIQAAIKTHCEGIKDPVIKYPDTVTYQLKMCVMNTRSLLNNSGSEVVDLNSSMSPILMLANTVIPPKSSLFVTGDIQCKRYLILNHPNS